MSPYEDSWLLDGAGLELRPVAPPNAPSEGHELTEKVRPEGAQPRESASGRQPSASLPHA
jgi:hypothetical protein